MKFFSATGVIAKARRFVNGGIRISEDRIKDPTTLTDILRDMSVRIDAIEGRLGPEVCEYQVDVGNAGAITRIAHSFSCPVRYWVSYWGPTPGGASPTVAPRLIVDPSTTENELVLASYAAGRAIIRIEPSQAGVG